MSLAANKVKGIRAACCSDAFSAEFTRRHNDANILCLGGRVVDEEKAVQLVSLFLHTPFEGGRHAVRIAEIAKIENGELQKLKSSDTKRFSDFLGTFFAVVVTTTGRASGEKGLG